MTDKLAHLWEMQAQFNTRIQLPDWDEPQDEEDRTYWLLNMVRAMQQECAELTDCVPWKWWAHYQQGDWENAKVEVVDLFHFLISAAQIVGLSADDLYAEYCRKMAVNHARQDSGYTLKYDVRSEQVDEQGALYTLTRNGTGIYVKYSNEPLSVSDLCGFRQEDRLHAHIQQCVVCQEGGCCDVAQAIFDDCVCVEG